MGSYENLAGGLFAASAALFAGWLAWSAVQVQISAEETRAAADRVEIENVLQRDLDDMADGLAAIWRILADLEQSPPPADTLTDRLRGVVYGIDRITKDVPTLRQMVTVLGWERRRIYEAWLDNLERLGSFRNVDSFDISSALDMTMDVTSYARCSDQKQYPILKVFGGASLRLGPLVLRLRWRLVSRDARHPHARRDGDAVTMLAPSSVRAPWRAFHVGTKKPSPVGGGSER